MDLLILETQRLLLPLISADDVTALVHGRRLSHWVPDFPADGDREIAGLLARTGIPSGPDADFAPRLVVERDSALAVGSAGFLFTYVTRTGVRRTCTSSRAARDRSPPDRSSVRKGGHFRPANTPLLHIASGREVLDRLAAR